MSLAGAAATVSAMSPSEGTAENDGGAGGCGSDGGSIDCCEVLAVSVVSTGILEARASNGFWGACSGTGVSAGAVSSPSSTTAPSLVAPLAATSVMLGGAGVSSIGTVMLPFSSGWGES